MANYTLTVTTYVGNPTVPWASHFVGRVHGENPGPCHGNVTHYNAPGHRGKTTCEKGHELSKRTEWDVEAAWSKERYERYAASGFEGDGPNQFRTEQDVIDTAAARFLGKLPNQWWESGVAPGEPGDKLYAGWIPRTNGDRDLIQENWGTVIAEVPAATSPTGPAVMHTKGPSH